MHAAGVCRGRAARVDTSTQLGEAQGEGVGEQVAEANQEDVGDDVKDEL